MSADNGIYIGVFPSNNSNNEYRVIYAFSIEDVYNNEDLVFEWFSEKEKTWRNVGVFNNEKLAYNYA
jgi:hypothetical protein